MLRKSVHFSNAGWRQRQKQQKALPQLAALSRKETTKPRKRRKKTHPTTEPRPPPRKRVELVELAPLQWVGGLWDPHWQYKLVIRTAPSKVRRVYECRYSTLRSLLEEKPAEPFVFPATHWLPRGKIFDSYEDAEARGREMLEALRRYTAADILGVVEHLTLVDEETTTTPVAAAGEELSLSGASTASGESV